MMQILDMNDPNFVDQFTAADDDIRFGALAYGLVSDFEKATTLPEIIPA